MEAANKGGKPDFFRRLFFPATKDQEGGALVGILYLNDKWFTQWSLPELSQSFSVGSEQVHTRRPGFLINLSDDNYGEFFRNLKANPGIKCPTWYVLTQVRIDQLANTSRNDIARSYRLIAHPMKRALQHVIY